MRKSSYFRALATVTLAGCLAGLLSACQDAPSQPRGEEFPPEGQVRVPERFAEVQSAAGASADATLYPCHFAGKQLNSLGQAKLDLMLKASEAPCPMTVYLNLPADQPLYGQQAAAVEAYLTAHGLKPAQFQVQAGPNPDSKGSAKDNLANLSKTESGSAAPPPPGQSPGGGDMGVIPSAPNLGASPPASH